MVMGIYILKVKDENGIVGVEKIVKAKTTVK